MEPESVVRRLHVDGFGLGERQLYYDLADEGDDGSRLTVDRKKRMEHKVWTRRSGPSSFGCASLPKILMVQYTVVPG